MKREEYYETHRASASLEDYSTAQVLIPAVSGKVIVLCDIVGSKITGGGEFRFKDGDTEFLRVYPNTNGSNTSSINFTAPLKMTAGNPLKLELDDGDTQWSVLVTYYYL
tara:strand:+ start:5336 stop:5662 length:327 start_codon:yes stop_codon:yes gene_type:complete